MELQTPFSKLYNSSSRPLPLLFILVGVFFCCLNTYLLFFVPELFPKTPEAQFLRYSLLGLWSIAILGEAVDVWGFLPFWRRHRQQPPLKVKGHLIVRFVSRGTNPGVLAQSAKRARELLSLDGGVSFDVQLVTQRSVQQEFESDERQHYSFIVVPDSYVCPNGSLYKARALEYARVHGPKLGESPEDTWVLFFDEETKLTESAIGGVKLLIQSDTARNRIGQGMIVYTDGNFGRPFFVTLADCQRVGYDLGRFRLQYETFHTMIFGFHGSFFVTSQKIIDEIGFDFGAEASLTEDIYFSAVAADRGIIFDHLHGFVREQSPESYMDYLRQRRRWMTGLTRFICDGRISLLRRIPIMLGNIATRVNGIIFLLLVSCLLIDPSYRLSSAAALIVYLGMWRPNFFMGLAHTVMDAPVRSSRERLKLACLFIITAPVVSVLEATASLYAIICPLKGFDVVKKSVVEKPPQANEAMLPETGRRMV